jgi:hypothetical protein
MEMQNITDSNALSPSGLLGPEFNSSNASNSTSTECAKVENEYFVFSLISFNFQLTYFVVVVFSHLDTSIESSDWISVDLFTDVLWHVLDPRSPLPQLDRRWWARRGQSAARARCADDR